MNKSLVHMKEESINYDILKYIQVLFVLGFCCWTSLAMAQPQQEEVVIPGVYQMPETSNNTTSNKPKSVRDAVRIDLHKFMGYEVLPTRYFSLPYDVFIKTNVGSFFTDIGFFLLLLFPLVLLFPGARPDRKSNLYNFCYKMGSISLLSLFLIISISGALLNKYGVSKIDTALELLTAEQETNEISILSFQLNKLALKLYTPIHGWFISFSSGQDSFTYPMLFLLFGLLIYLVYERIKNHTLVTKALVLFIMSYLCLWWLLGAGAAWYGIVLFCVPYIFVVKALVPARELSWEWNMLSLSHFKFISLISISLIWGLLAFTHRASNYNPINPERATHLYVPPLMEYQMNKINKEKLQGFIFSMATEIQKVVNAEDQTLVYRVGTQLNYFIRKNDRRVFNDTFLDFFQELVQRFKTKEKIAQALKASGFNYILIDLSMSDNDLTPEKNLTKKFTQLMNTLYNNPHIDLVVTNRVLETPDGKTINAVFENRGAIVNRGNVALFQIK